MTTPTTTHFLNEIAKILLTKDGPKLQAYLLLEPPLPPLYQVLLSEIQQAYPPGTEERLEAQCEALLPEYDEAQEESGGAWTAFVTFLVQYFTFLRDVDAGQLVETHDLLKALLKYVGPQLYHGGWFELQGEAYVFAGVVNAFLR